MYLFSAKPNWREPDNDRSRWMGIAGWFRNALAASMTFRTSDSNWYFGRIGIDLLGRVQQVNLNFKTMTLELR
jgi:hypothetical protein